LIGPSQHFQSQTFPHPEIQGFHEDPAGAEIPFYNNFRLETVSEYFLEVLFLLLYLPDFRLALPLGVHFKNQAVGRGDVKPELGNNLFWERPVLRQCGAGYSET
jgi:hypothetical protein